MSSAVVEIALGTGHGVAVIAGHDNERVVQFAGCLKRFEHAGQVLVEMLDLKGVVEEFASCHGIVGNALGQQRLPQLLALFLPSTNLVVLVRLGRTVPEKNGLSLSRLPRKSAKLAA